MKMNFAYSFLFDTQGTLTVTINGQLMLLMLVEQLALEGIPTISANTDGIICKIPKDKLDTYYRVCNDFAKYVDIAGEYTDYIKYYRLDVNNYITVKQKKDGTLDVKRKGQLNQHLCTEDLKKGFNKPIIAKAVEAYFIDGTPVSETIRNERNIYLFCVTQNMSSDFTPIHRKIVNRKFVEEKMQKNVRFYVSKKGGVLLKLKGNKTTSVISGENVTIFNDYFSVDDFNDYHIKYEYYIVHANKLIAAIESGVKGNTKRIKTKQGNRLMNDLFSVDALEEIKIPCKGENYELAEESEIVVVPADNLKQFKTITPEYDPIGDETIYDSSIADKAFDIPERIDREFDADERNMLKSSDVSPFTGNQEYVYDSDEEDDDLPF